jgi:hypothetical protein
LELDHPLQAAQASLFLLFVFILPLSLQPVPFNLYAFQPLFPIPIVLTAPDSSNNSNPFVAISICYNQISPLS